MDDARKGQIAIKYLKHRLLENGIRLKPEFRRDVGNQAKAIGIPIEEAMEFAEIIVRELVNEAFEKKPGEPTS